MKLFNKHLPTNLSVIILVFYSAFLAVGCHKPSASDTSSPQSISAFKSSSFTETKTPKKRIYLTFDDGPGEGTNNVLNIAENEKVLVTFFLIGKHVYDSKIQTNTWDRLKASQHIELCNHGYTHALRNKYNLFYKNPDLVVNDFKRSEDSLRFANNIARTPGRNIWRVGNLKKTDNIKSKIAADSLYNAGFTLMGWDLEWHYNPHTLDVTITADSLIKQIDTLFAKNRTRKPGNLVILAHDKAYKHSYDSDQLRQLIEKLKRRDDYELLWLTEYSL